MRTLLVAVRTVLYMTGFLFCFGWLTLHVRRFDRNLTGSLPGGTEIPSIFLLFVGGIFGLTCVWVFVATGRGTPAPFDALREFVAVGPYRYSRNPMYIGGLCLLAGLGLYEHSISILLMALVVFAVVHLFVVFYEELTLRRKFGSSYQRLLPRSAAVDSEAAAPAVKTRQTAAGEPAILLSTSKRNKARARRIGTCHPWRWCMGTRSRDVSKFVGAYPSPRNKVVQETKRSCLAGA